MWPRELHVSQIFLLIWSTRWVQRLEKGLLTLSEHLWWLRFYVGFEFLRLYLFFILCFFVIFIKVLSVLFRLVFLSILLEPSVSILLTFANTAILRKLNLSSNELALWNAFSNNKCVFKTTHYFTCNYLPSLANAAILRQKSVWHLELFDFCFISFITSLIDNFSLKIVECNSSVK